jgi:hypothetical protein
MYDRIMNFDDWHSSVDIVSTVTLAVIHSKMNRCLSSFVNTVKTAFTNAIMMWFTLMSSGMWHHLGAWCPTVRNNTIKNSVWTFQPLKIRLLCCLKMLGIKHPMARHHTAEEQRPEQHGCKSLKIHGTYIIFVHNCVTCFVNKNCWVVWR